MHDRKHKRLLDDLREASHDVSWEAENIFKEVDAILSNPDVNDSPAAFGDIETAWEALEGNMSELEEAMDSYLKHQKGRVW